MEPTPENNKEIIDALSRNKDRVMDALNQIERKPCGCTIKTFPGGKKTFAPCIPCGLMQAGAALVEASNSWWRRRRALRMAGAALAAVATTINNAAVHANAVTKAVEGITDAEA